MDNINIECPCKRIKCIRHKDCAACRAHHLEKNNRPPTACDRAAEKAVKKLLKKEVRQQSYPYGYCGMPCALCSRYRTEGKSKCLGCSHGGYYTDTCKVNHCCTEKKLVHCGLCYIFPCERLGKMKDFSDLNTNHVKQRTCAAVSKDGFDAWYAEYIIRAKLLTQALAAYNDGRMKRYLCELFIQKDILVLSEIMSRAKSLCGTQKEKGKAFRALADDFLASLEK